MPRPSRFTTTERHAIAAQAAAAYADRTTTIRALADRHQCGYGTMRTLLLEGGATLRPRGGGRRRPGR